LTPRAQLSAFLFSATLAFAGSAAAAPPPQHELTVPQQAAIARAFAPTFVFHPDEDYFPTSSMVPSGTGGGVATWHARVEQYRTLTRAEKLQRAAVAYRVFPRLKDGRTEVVVEYWCYYVFNAFTIKGGWLPYRVHDNHPHDLERLYVVLWLTEDVGLDDVPIDEIRVRRTLQVHSIIANAHDGSIPPNQYTVAKEEALPLPLTILVERGSHAMAPDIDGDGRFTPAIDSTEVRKVQWGIRDSGSTWGWYRTSYMDTRDASAVRVCGPSPPPTRESYPCEGYVLYAAGELQRWFGEQRLSGRDRSDVLGSTPWLTRTFGDIRVEELMVPSDPGNGQALNRMVRRRERTETGFVVGFTSVQLSPAVVFGGRYVKEVASRRTPDLIAETMVVASSGSRASVEATLWSSYSLDAVTNIVVGGGWFSNTGSGDLAAGIDFRIGRFRVRPTWRMRTLDFDARLTTTF